MTDLLGGRAFAILGILAVTAQAPTEPSSSTQAVVKKGTVPISKDVPQIRLPKVTEADLSNGLHLIVLEDHRLPQVSFQIIIPGAGGYYDPENMNGLASFTATVMREGTTTRTSSQISQQLEVMAASLAVGAGISSIDATISGSCLSDQFDRLLGLTADVLLHPSFPDDEVARFKRQTRTQLIQQRASPGFLASEVLSRALYGAHPASRVAPSLAALDKTTRDALAEFHRERYVPDHAGMAIAGDISMAEVRKIVEARLAAAWKKTGVPEPTVGDPPPISGSKVHFIGRPDSVQTNLVVGTQAIERTNPEYDVLRVMNAVIGGGPTGRLFMHLREQKGYTYGAYSSLDAPVHRGNWSASTNVRTEVTGPALHDLLAEIGRLRDERVPEGELSDVQRAMVASFALSLESPEQLVGLHVTRWRYRLPENYWDRFAERVMAVTPDQVQAAARKYLAADRLQVVAVGDPSRVVDTLKTLGAVTTYDTEGRRVGEP